MINQRYCPFCKQPAARSCRHLALAAEGRDFVQRCIDACGGQAEWKNLCGLHREQQRAAGNLGPGQDDFMWLESAFCDRFLKHLAWFGGMDYEWRSGPRAEQGGFWVLLWSKDPQRLWWELRDALERNTVLPLTPPESTAPWLIWLNPR